MADFRLADTMNSAEALFQAVGIPRQVVVHHQMRANEIYTLARGIGGNQHEHFPILRERLLCFPALLTVHAAVNCDDSFTTPEKPANAVAEVIERIAVLGENNQLAAVALCI